MPVTPSEREDQYFFEEELKKLLGKSRKEQEAVAAGEKKWLKELHFMHCPKCGQQLMTENYGAVEVDVCAGCKGLWLDANELDQILESKEQAGPWRKFLKVLRQ
jgi:uncharacterized protein